MSTLFFTELAKSKEICMQGLSIFVFTRIKYCSYCTLGSKVEDNFFEQANVNNLYCVNGPTSLLQADHDLVIMFRNNKIRP